ncbi:DUF885 domain-containing protein [Marinigracilibium pacificum]|uniref:DUF885 domain-containing protein n=1 Tax=Marinigracilibium pacificum TaxID=2729599 RepID=A0A848J1K8_9BACT|nr:DUF885 domain-containing protein [Marinigracilibium pacificum]NMM50703.1 DUF885 domain-containing protein [Marinigracilibium pacificum]
MRFFKEITFLFTVLIIVISCNNESNEQELVSYSEEEIKKESEKANHFFDSVFDASVNRSPIYQSYLGIKKDYDKWDDISDEQTQKELEITKKELQYLLDNINPDALDKQTGISYKLFKESAENEIEDFKWRFHNYPVNQMFGLHSQVPAMLINIHQVSDSSDAAAYISRLEGINSLFDQLIKNLEIREEKGIVPPKFVFTKVIEDCENIIKGAPFDTDQPSTLLNDITKKVNALNIFDESKSALIKAAEKELIESVQPAYVNLLSFLKEQQERATNEDGIWKWPNGSEYYNIALKRTTTTDLTSDEIHEIGLKEVDRIHSEMREIMKKVGFEGTLQEFFTFLKTDDQFYYANTDQGKEEYMDSAKSIIDNMESRLDELFITKPKARIQVKRVEKFRENSAGKAFYQAPAPDGSRPGTYYANLANSKNMPKFEMEALAYHEGIPGHHMDRTIAQELSNIPKFRKFGGYTAYVEGWGLYSEFIPKEMGLYENPYSDYGRLAMELWRACRLVVDTGIHSKKWTREQGIEYYLTNTSGSERECERMVERHIVMPSQATAYKIGMLEILRLREKAQTELGDKFDIKEFHEVVLTNGAVPLNVLSDLVEDYIANVKTKLSRS